MNSKQIKSLLLLCVVLFSFNTIFAAVPAGYYYFAQNKKKAELKTALHQHCAPMFEFDYGGGPGFTWQGFFSTDRNSDNSVIDMYSDSVRYFNGYAAVNGMNIEHSFPKSWWGAYENAAYKDLFHLYPADAITNIVKNNLPLGEVTGTPSLNNGKSKIGKNGFGTAYTDNCFEPADEYKGDFARSYFYIATVYENLAPLMQSPMVINNSTYPFWRPWAIDLLLKWNRQDPVSPKELARVEAIYGIQGNRNPFIDYPGLAEYIWGADTTNVYPFPAETQPFLVTPRRGESLDFGVILQNDRRTMPLHILGVNISSDVQVSLEHQSSTLSLSTPVISASNALGGTDLSITFTPAAAGIVLDTLLIQGGGLAEILRIPVKALASSDFITVEPTEITPVGGTLNWISDPLATDYRLNVYQGDQQAGDLIISTYVEGSSWNKAIELFNGTGKTVDLSKYYLQKQSNGAGYFGSALRLSGSLSNGKSFVIVHKQAASDLLAKANLVTDSLLQYNGNDAIQLVRSGVTIDMVGQANAGADVMWGVDLTLQRKPEVTHPSSTFNAAEWTSLPIDSYSMLGNHPMTLTSSKNYILQNVMTGLTTNYPIQNLNPEATYTYSIESMRSGVIVPSINTMQLHTSALDAPEISEAGNIMSHQFTANWGPSAYATGYLLNVFTASGQANTTETEGFDKVGSNGTPLPDGWTGTVSGIYTTATSSGVAVPALNPKTNGEWVQTRNYPSPVSKLAFMYRYASASVGSSFLIEALSNNTWTNVATVPYNASTSKFYPVYNFTKEQGIKAFRFTYNKVGSGNLALDDIAVTYGSQDTTFIEMNKPVLTNSYVVSGLSAATTCFYQVRATLGNAVSAPSDIMKVTTLITDAVKNDKFSTVRVSVNKDEITISGLNANEQVQVYTITGVCVYNQINFRNVLNIRLPKHGMYILKVSGNDERTTIKFRL